jgi:hypothetical protein
MQQMMVDAAMVRRPISGGPLLPITYTAMRQTSLIGPMDRESNL